MVRLLAALFVASALPVSAGTIVEIRMSIGTIGIELFDDTRPITVANFLNYVSSGRYDGTFAHRLIPGFVLQGGGYALNGDAPQHIEAFAPIQNEFSVGPTYSNTFGTIAMAKIPAEDGAGNPIPGGGPNSATSEWFINLGNNAANLDNQNGGFTVFGQVVYGLDLLTAINTAFSDSNHTDFDVRNAGGALSNLPLTYVPANNSLLISSLLYTEIVVVPEPSTLFLLGVAGLGLGGIAFTRGRGRSRAADGVPLRRVPARFRDGSPR